MPRFNVFYKPWLRGRTVQKGRVEATDEKKVQKEILRQYPQGKVVGVFQIRGE